MLGQALTDVWLAKGDVMQAGPEAERFLELTLATAERTWQALAWETRARVAISTARARVSTTRCRRWKASRSPLLRGAYMRARRNWKHAGETSARRDVTARSAARRLSPWQILWWITNVSAQHSLRRRRCARS
jgi:hypothetical protein